MGSDPSRDNDGVGSDDARFHRGSDPIFLDATVPELRVGDGDRTHGHWSHNPALYQLSYAHHKKRISLSSYQN